MDFTHSCWIFFIVVSGNLLLSAAQLAANTEKPPEVVTYQYGYDYGQQYHHEKKDSNGVVTGEYGYESPDGWFRIYNYTADKNGFRVNRKRVRSRGNYTVDGGQKPSGKGPVYPYPVYPTYPQTGGRPYPTPSDREDRQHTQGVNGQPGGQFGDGTTRPGGSGTQPGGQYPGGSGTQPGGQYPGGSGTQPGGSGTQPGGQYPGGSGTQPGGQYPDGSTGGGTYPGGQYGTDGITRPSDQYPDGSGSPSGTGDGQLGGSGTTAQNGQYPGGTGSGELGGSGTTAQGGQYPGGSGIRPGSQYPDDGTSGTDGGITRPGSQYPDGSGQTPSGQATNQYGGTDGQYTGTYPVGGSTDDTGPSTGGAGTSGQPSGAGDSQEASGETGTGQPGRQYPGYGQTRPPTGQISVQTSSSVTTTTSSTSQIGGQVGSASVSIQRGGTTAAPPKEQPIGGIPPLVGGYGTADGSTINPGLDYDVQIGQGGEEPTGTISITSSQGASTPKPPTRPIPSRTSSPPIRYDFPTGYKPISTPPPKFPAPVGPQGPPTQYCQVPEGLPKGFPDNLQPLTVTNVGDHQRTPEGNLVGHYKITFPLGYVMDISYTAYQDPNLAAQYLPPKNQC